MTDRELARAIGANVCAAREAANLSQGELAERTGLIQGNVSRLESGVHLPSLSTLNKVSKALGVTISSLLKTN